MHPIQVVAALGGVASIADLRAAGIPAPTIRRAAHRGDLVRVRTGWYAVPGCDTALVSAARAGGRLGCVSALARHGVWTLDDHLVHVRVGRGATVRRDARVRVHWDHDHLTGGPPIDSPVTALTTAVSCLDLRHAVAVTDSVLQLRLAAVDEVERALLVTPRGRRVLALSDPAAESGLESFARLGLRALRVHVRSQVVVPGVGRVDLLIGDRLVLELDGAAWHGGVADFERDRERDRRLMVLGYLVIRATYRQVMQEWPTLREQIVALVRRREHLWRQRDPAGRSSWSEDPFESDRER